MDGSYPASPASESIREGRVRERAFERLEAQITELWGHLNAATYRFLKLLAEFDRRQGYERHGLANTAQWLNWACGIGRVAAWEKVRVARALESLPQISSSFERGEISYSKVRAMTRVATASTEPALLNVALHGTASHIERLRRLAETFLDYEIEGNGSNADRYQIVVHVDGAILSHEGAERETGPHRCELEDGPALALETVRRLACDAALVGLVESSDGEPLSVGRKTRAIPPALQRALAARDGGCRFPGCDRTRFTEGHHVKHWANGGETKLSNLITLCHFHHRLIHEGGFGLAATDDGLFVFTRPNGQRIAENGGCFCGNTSRPSPEDTPMRSLDECLEIYRQHEEQGLEIDAHTSRSRWLGESLDYSQAIEWMQAEAKAAARRTYEALGM